jgi:glutamate transport system permease protein
LSAVTDNLGLFLDGYLRSLSICLWALVGSLVLGVLIAACRVSPVPPLRAFGAFWVTTFRNTPPRGRSG